MSPLLLALLLQLAPHDAGDIVSGTIPAARLPQPGSGTRGGVEAVTCTGTDKLSAIGADGVPVCAADEGGAGGGVPSGAIVLIVSGTCAGLGAGWTEEASLAGKFVLGTTNGAGDIGGTGGADSITPAGNNAGGAVDAHAGTAVADHASHTHTYTDVVAHTHVVTSQTATTGGATSYEHGTLDTSSAEAEATEVTGSTGGANGTTAGPSATLAHSVTQPNAHTFTQPTWTGTQFDNRPAFLKVIFCKAP
jgi:hypothetical protein